jgi:hypothetical protein
VSVVIEAGKIENDQSFLQSCSNGKTVNYTQLGNYVGELQFIGATLQLRGLNPIIQPFIDSSRNALIYNGKFFTCVLFFPIISVLHVLLCICFNFESDLVLQF